MAQKPETKFRQKFRAKLEEIPNSFWESIQQKAIQGTPDILGCVNGYFVAIELKATSDSKVTPLQEHKLLCITKAGGYAGVACPENCDDMLRELYKLSTEKKDDYSYLERNQ